MGASNGIRGRPQRLRDDPVPLHEQGISIETRIGWLLATSRILHADEAMRRFERFAELAGDRGLHVDRSRISRWETGQAAAGWDVIEVYESVLGRAPGSLSTIAGELRRAFGDGVLRNQRGGGDPDGTPDDLLDPALGQQQLTGQQWQELARRLAAYDAFYLRREDWGCLATRLLAELGRSSGTAYVRRFQAAARMFRHPSAQCHLARALGRCVMDPDAQVVTPLLWVLAAVREPATASLALRMLESDKPALREAAATVAAVHLRSGMLPESGLFRLEGYVVRSLRGADVLDEGLDPLDVAVQLPVPSFRRVLDQLPDRPLQVKLERARRTGELVSTRRAGAVVDDLVARVRSDEAVFLPHQQPDLMLGRLLREALFHVHKSRRHHAALLLAASPYRRPVARQLQDLVGGPQSFLAARAWTVLMRVGQAGRRCDVLRSAMRETRPELRSRALVSVGLGDRRLSTGEARTLVASLSTTDPEPVRHATFFALGMSGSALLSDLADHESEAYRRPARWWQAQGPAIRD